MTWKQRAHEIIAEATRGLSNATPLEERKRVVDGARPRWCSSSWPRKAWQAARREHLVPFGYRPRTKKAKAASKTLPLFTQEELL